jgi:hypothetical protein
MIVTIGDETMQMGTWQRLSGAPELLDRGWEAVIGQVGIAGFWLRGTAT